MVAERKDEIDEKKKAGRNLERLKREGGKGGEHTDGAKLHSTAAPMSKKLKKASSSIEQ